MAAVSAFAQKTGKVSVDSVTLARNGGRVQLAMDVTIGREKMDHDHVVVITPRLVGEGDSVDFPQVAIYGRNAYYYDVRDGRTPIGTDDAYKIRYKGGPRTEHYARTIDHQPWMVNSRLKLIMADGPTCDVSTRLLCDIEAFTMPKPDTTYVEHEHRSQEELTGSVSGQARIQFIVNKTDFVPTLANNQRELEKMHQSIRDVQADRRVRITKYRIKGYASPEGSWDNNVRLAQGRTERVREFMVDQWGVPQEQIEINYEPEDWQGFRDYVDQHRDTYTNADAIIDIIDSDMEPDPKLARIVKEHPAAYRKLLAECFPALRRTDYNIDYDWIDIIERQGKSTYDTIITQPQPQADDLLEEDVLTLKKPSKPWLALKTNLLFDALLAPNVELELRLSDRWTLMVEDWFPWWLYRHNALGKSNRYHRDDWDSWRNAYEIWTLGAELRYWFPRRCPMTQPRFTGTFIGIYGAGGKYDWEWTKSEGDQGEFTSFGLTIGRAWALSQAWNLELSLSAGYMGGPYRHYEGMFDDSRLIWQYTSHMRYIGPTKVKVSIAWLMPTWKKQKRKQKGGAHE